MPATRNTPKVAVETSNAALGKARLAISAASLLVIVIGAVLAWLEIGATNKTINAGNVFQIQKEARDIRKRTMTRNYREILSISDDREFRLFDDDDRTRCAQSPTCQVLSFDVNEATWAWFNHFMSVYRLSDLDVLPDLFVETFANEFCGFVRKPAIKYVWGRQGKSHAELVSSDTLMVAENGAAQKINILTGEEDPYEKMRKDWCGKSGKKAANASSNLCRAIYCRFRSIRERRAKSQLATAG